MKKTGIIIAVLIAAAFVLFFAFGGKELRQEAKAQLDQELHTLQQYGFGIEDRISKEEEDHFILSFNDPEKIAAYFTLQGSPATAEDIAPLKGMKLGTDVYYLKDAYSALSADLYPVKLPESLYDNAQDKEDKALLEQIQKMLDKKKLLIHIDVAKNFSDFKGYMKDINETFTGEESLTLRIKDFTFTGETQKERISKIDQKVKEITFEDDKGITVTLHNMTTKHTITGPSPYDIDAIYDIERIIMEQTDTFTGEIRGIRITSTEKVTNGLLQSHIKSTAQLFQIEADTEHITVKNINWDARIDNVDIDALKTIQTLDPEKEEEKIQQAFTQMLEKGLHLTINDFSIKEILDQGKNLGGVKLQASLGINKHADLSLAQQNPMLLLDALNTELTLKLSNEIFALVAKDPRAMMLMMLIPPKEEKGHKIYTIIMKNGKTTVNGTPL
jgi:hypothetical protein